MNKNKNIRQILSVSKHYHQGRSATGLGLCWKRAPYAQDPLSEAAPRPASDLEALK